jgi:hypothetical protein
LLVTRKHSVEIICGARSCLPARVSGRTFVSCANEAAACMRLKQRLDILLQEAHAATAEAQGGKLARRAELIDGALADLKDRRNVGAGHELW